MKTGGIFVGIIGLGLVIWHLVKVMSNPNYDGYASHQVMSIDAVILIIVGVGLYVFGKRRLKRKRSADDIGGDV